MDENQFKAMVGEAAFNAMSAEQRTSAIKMYTDAKGANDKDKDKDKDKGKGKGKESEDDDSEEDDEDDSKDLRKTVAKGKQSDAEKKAELRRIEGTLKFNMGVEGFVKDNADILPAEIPEILKAAAKETYDSESDKAAAVRSAIVQSFFSVQDNVNLLTANQKTALDDYLKLTKNGKEQKADNVYENLFEPALETLRRVRKAEEVGKARTGIASGSKVEDAYKKRLMDNSKKNYLGDKA